MAHVVYGTAYHLLKHLSLALLLAGAMVSKSQQSLYLQWQVHSKHANSCEKQAGLCMPRLAALCHGMLSIAMLQSASHCDCLCRTCACMHACVLSVSIGLMTLQALVAEIVTRKTGSGIGGSQRGPLASFTVSRPEQRPCE